MKLERITLERLHSLGNYNNLKISITVTPEPEETADEAFDKAHTFIRAHLRMMVDKADEIYESSTPNRSCNKCKQTYVGNPVGPSSNWFKCTNCGSEDTRNYPR